MTKGDLYRHPKLARDVESAAGLRSAGKLDEAEALEAQIKAQMEIWRESALAKVVAEAGRAPRLAASNATDYLERPSGLSNPEKDQLASTNDHEQGEAVLARIRSGEWRPSESTDRGRGRKSLIGAAIDAIPGVGLLTRTAIDFVEPDVEEAAVNFVKRNPRALERIAQEIPPEALAAFMEGLVSNPENIRAVTGALGIDEAEVRFVTTLRTAGKENPALLQTLESIASNPDSPARQLLSGILGAVEMYPKEVQDVAALLKNPAAVAQVVQTFKTMMAAMGASGATGTPAP